MSPAEMDALRAARDEAVLERGMAQGYVIGIARLIRDDLKRGQPPSKFALELLAQLVDDHIAAEAEAVRTAEAVVAANDAAVGRVRS